MFILPCCRIPVLPQVPVLGRLFSWFRVLVGGLEFSPPIRLKVLQDFQSGRGSMSAHSWVSLLSRSDRISSHAFSTFACFRGGIHPSPGGCSTSPGVVRQSRADAVQESAKLGFSPTSASSHEYDTLISPPVIRVISFRNPILVDIYQSYYLTLSSRKCHFSRGRLLVANP